MYFCHFPLRRICPFINSPNVFLSKEFLNWFGCYGENSQMLNTVYFCKCFYDPLKKGLASHLKKLESSLEVN